jgi:hypothetical protein
MLINCACGATNRLPRDMTKSKARCGKCKHVFTPQELVKARPERAPRVEDFELENEEDSDDDGDEEDRDD